MSDRTWKARERRLAKLLGTHRIPVTGERHGADCETSLFAYQIKARRTIPGYLAAWLDGIRGARPSKVGVLILQRPRGQDLDACVVLSLRDWLALHREVRREEL